MLNEKHINQWASYIIEELPNWKELNKVLLKFPEIEKIFVDMYKKGYEDAKNELS